MHDIAGLVALAVIGLWIAYLVPHRLRYRQQLLESRTEDRFSGALRVLAVADARRDGRTPQARGECGPDSTKRSELLSPARGVPVQGRPAVTERRGVVERPYGTQDRISADEARRAAQLRARRAVALARRSAAARRRGVLTVVLAVASVAAWAVVGLGFAGVAVAVVPTVLLAAVVAMGRRAVVQARVADAAWERQQRAAQRPRSERTARVTGRALHPSDNNTEAIRQVRPGGPAGERGVPAREGVAAAPSDAAQRVSGGATSADVRGVDGEERSDARAVAEPAEVTAAGTESTASPGAGGAAGAPSAAPAAAPAPPAAAEPRDAVQTTQVVVAPAPVPSQVGDEGWSPVPVPRPTYTTKATAPRREPLPLVVEDAAPVAVEAPAGATSGGQEAGGAPARPAVDLDAILARRRAAGE